MSYGLFGREYSLDDVEQHPVWFFFTDRRPTDRDVRGGEIGLNALLLTMLLFAPFALFGLIGWGWSIVSLLALVLLWRNWRRFRQRLFHALAERDREGIEPPIHPDLR